jgi:hypothetical protein
MTIKITSLNNAIAQLEKSIHYANSPQALAAPEFQEQFQNSVIQCFAFTYELIRTGNEKGLLRSDWEKWRLYRQARTDSSHTYDHEKAEAVFAIAPDFLEEAKCKPASAKRG